MQTGLPLAYGVFEGFNCLQQFGDLLFLVIDAHLKFLFFLYG